MRRALIALLLSACCGSVFALEVTPPAPDSQTFFKLVVHLGYCTPRSGSVSVQGSTITMTLAPADPGITCVAAFPPIVANVGVLPAGVYAVSVRDAGGQEVEHSKIIVRDGTSDILVSPVGSRVEGGRDVQVFGATNSTSTAVLFDGIPATNVRVQGGTSLVVTPPPHAAGTVDVTVNDSNGTHKAVAAFTYFDPNAAPDPFVFEPLLYPVAYDGPGIFDSQWTTNNIMGSNRTLVRFKDLIGARVCTGDCSQFNWSAILSPDSQSGLLVWAVRRRLPAGVQDDFHVSSRIVDLSRLHGSGTSLPVAREKDFRSTFEIDDVPIGSVARVTLRLYSPDTADQNVDVTVTDDQGISTVRHATLHAVNGVGFASVDLNPGADVRQVTSKINVAPSGPTGSATPRLWGLVTVTDNGTQEVTAFWPQ
jgi:hypothetical protein